MLKEESVFAPFSSYFGSLLAGRSAIGELMTDQSHIHKSLCAEVIKVCNRCFGGQFFFLLCFFLCMFAALCRKSEYLDTLSDEARRGYETIALISNSVDP